MYHCMYLEKIGPYENEYYNDGYEYQGCEKKEIVEKSLFEFKEHEDYDEKDERQTPNKGDFCCY